MSIYGNQIFNEGFIDDIIKDWSKKREIKNKRSNAVDLALSAINKIVLSEIKNGVGIDRYDLLHAIGDAKFVKGKSNTWTVLYAPVDTNKDVNDLANKIANDVNTRLNIYELLKANNNNTQYNYEYYKGLFITTIRNSLFESKLFATAIRPYWNAVEDFVTEENSAKIKESIENSIKNTGFGNVMVSLSTDPSGYRLIVTITMSE